MTDHCGQGDAQVVVGLEEVGLEGQGAVQARDRLVVAARVGLDLAEAVEGVRLVGGHELVHLRFSMAFS